MSRDALKGQAVRRSKYAPLFHSLAERSGTHWRTSFGEIEAIVGFTLPKSARLYRPWWANDERSGHSQSMAWTMAGWKTGNVDLDAETLEFRREI